MGRIGPPSYRNLRNSDFLRLHNVAGLWKTLSQYCIPGFQVGKRLWVKHVTIRLKLPVTVYFRFRDFGKSAPLLSDLVHLYEDRLVEGQIHIGNLDISNRSINRWVFPDCSLLNGRG